MTTASEIVEYRPIEAVIAVLRERHLNVVIDVSTKEGMAVAVAGRAELRSVLNDLEEARVKKKSDSLAFGRLLDSEAKRIAGQIEPMKVAYDDQIMAKQRAEKAAAEARILAEQQRIEAEVEAKRKVEEAKLREAQAEVTRRQVELDKAEREARQKREDEQLKLELDQRVARAAIEHEERTARDARAVETARLDAERKVVEDARRKVEDERIEVERIARVAKKAEEDRLQAIKDEAEAKERAIRQAEAEEASQKQQARTILQNFVARFGKRPEFAGVVRAINALKETV